MFIVQSTLRPPRLAFAFSTVASDRVLNRVFRLVGGRWGGRYDLLLCLAAGDRMDTFNAAVLRAADPDFILVVDPRLDSYDWNDALAIADQQPFGVIRFRERMERARLGWAFRTQPTSPGSDEPPTHVRDYDNDQRTWRVAARWGLIPTSIDWTRVKPTENGVSPVMRSTYGLRGSEGDDRWVFFAPQNDFRVAGQYWSVRALGGRPVWFSEGAITRRKRHPLLRRSTRAFLVAPNVPERVVADAAARWSRRNHEVLPAPNDPYELFSEVPKPFIVNQVSPISDHGGFVRLATPVALVPRGQQVRSQLRGVLEHRLRSPDAYDPDGLVLARTAGSRGLVGDQRRITRRGVAEITNLATSQLVRLPVVSYRDAVSAPFVDAGYKVAPSDKGLYQQRALELAKGLLYLAWLLRQPESNRLLEMFFTYHLSGRPPPEYRRAVRYEELRVELFDLLRERRARVRAALTARADAWLKSWSNGMLERGLMIGGYVLVCSQCAQRAWYDAEVVTNHFRCRRCAHESIVPGGAVRSFHLNEAFYQFKLHQGQVVTLVLARLRSEAKESFLYLPETSLDDGARTREIDAAALVDGKLIIVEAKSTAALSQTDIARYKDLARKTHAWRLVFATSEPAWNPATSERIAGARDELTRSGVDVASLHREQILESPAPRELELFSRRAD